MPSAVELLLLNSGPRQQTFNLTAAIPSGWVFTRAGNTATYWNRGTLYTALANAPRFEFDVNGNALGYLNEPAATNSIRNNTMAGAAAGTPGTLPTNWAFTSLQGLSSQIVGVGTESGISYIDIRFYGTRTGSSSVAVQLETTTGIAASSGQSWTTSYFARLAAGSLANVSTTQIGTNFLNAGGMWTSGFGTPFTLATSGLIGAAMAAVTQTADAAAVYTQPYFAFTGTNGSAVDFTLRIGLPQVEAGTFATSRIITGATAVTRNADNLTVPLSTLYPWWWRAGNGGTIVFNWTVPTGNQTGAVIGGVSSSAGNLVEIILVNATQYQIRTYVGGNGVSSSLYTISSGLNTTAFSIGPASTTYSANGVTGVLVNAGMPAPTTLTIGHNPTSLTSFPVMHSPSLPLRAGPSTAAQLQAMR
jgi:hypothetical protein